MEEKEIVKEEPAGKKVSFSKQQQTKKASRADHLQKQIEFLDRKIDIVGEKLLKILGQLEQSVTMAHNDHTLALMKAYDRLYADCQVIKEGDIDPNGGKDFNKIIGFFFEHKGEVVRVIPIEDGWKMTEITPDNQESPKVFTLNFEFKGIATTPDYPTTYKVETEDPYSGIMKLREYLFSLKENKVII